MDKNKYYKIKEIADKAGVTVRTLRYYDKIGLLKPSYKNELNYRFYTDRDLVELQQIISLKFLGFSINEIEEIKSAKSEEQIETLKKKKRLLEQKIKHLNFINDALEEVENKLDMDKDINWCVIANEIKSSRIESHKVNCSVGIKDKKMHSMLHGELMNTLMELTKVKNDENEKEIVTNLKVHMDKMLNNDRGLNMLIEVLEDIEDMPGMVRGLKGSEARTLIDILNKYV